MERERVVVITGAAGGIGAALVKRFLANDDTVIATDARQDALEGLRTATEGHAKLVTVAGDVSKEPDCGRIAKAARDRAGRVDVLVNCAGYFPVQPFEDMTVDQWRQVVDINLTGPFLTVRAMLPLMKGRGWGRIVNIGSASMFEGVPGQAHYTAAKAGVVGLSRSIAREFGEHGITVNVVTPGLTATPPVRKSMPEMLGTEREKRALPRDEQPEDLVGAVFFLASPGADFITGQTLNVDGGKTTR